MNFSEMTVLVVDDIASIQRIVAQLLRRLGVQTVLQASNGNQAMDILRSKTVDIVLSDWQMPEMDGLALLQWMRGSDKHNETPFIMLTGDTEREKIIEAISSGVNDLIVKPFTSKTLQERMLGVFERSPSVSSPSLRDKTSTDEDPVEATTIELDQSRQRGTILLIDDDPSVLTILGNALKDDYRVLTAKDGDLGVSMCQSDSPPDLVLLDLIMPTMGGFEVLEALRSHPISDHIPVIIVSSVTEHATQVEGLQGGALEYLTKPIDVSMLKLRVKNLMQIVNHRKDMQADYDNMLRQHRLQQDVDQLMLSHFNSPLKSALDDANAISDKSLAQEDVVLRANKIKNSVSAVMQTANLAVLTIKLETKRYVLQEENLDLEFLVSRQSISVGSQFASKQIEIYRAGGSENNPIEVVADPELVKQSIKSLLAKVCDLAPGKSRIQVAITDQDDVYRISYTFAGKLSEQDSKSFWKKQSKTTGAKQSVLNAYATWLMVDYMKGDVGMSYDELENKTSVYIELKKTDLSRLM